MSRFDNGWNINKKKEAQRKSQAAELAEQTRRLNAEIENEWRELANQFLSKFESKGENYFDCNGWIKCQAVADFMNEVLLPEGYRAVPREGRGVYDFDYVEIQKR